MLKKFVFLSLIVSIALSACGTLEVSLDRTPTPAVDEGLIATMVAATLAALPSTTAIPEPMATPTPTIPSPKKWKTYSNSEYSFSIDYPADFEITPGTNNTPLYIGEQIHIWMSDVDPLVCRGDCPVVENTDSASVAGFEAIKAQGYIGSIGGNIPQRYISYILQRDGRYYKFTLYALSLHAKNECCSTIWPLQENDIELFEQILATLKFEN